MLATAQRFRQGGGTTLRVGWSSGTAAQPGSKALCSGLALTQEGNTPFMEVPGALSFVPVRACACARVCVPEVGRGPPLMLHAPLPLSGLAFSKQDGKQMGKEEPGICRAQAESGPGFQSMLRF